MKEILLNLYNVLFNPQSVLIYVLILIPIVPIMRIKINNKKLGILKSIIPDIVVVILFVINMLIYNYIEDLYTGWDGLIVIWSFISFAAFFVLDIITSIGYGIYRMISSKSLPKNNKKVINTSLFIVLSTVITFILVINLYNREDIVIEKEPVIEKEVEKDVEPTKIEINNLYRKVTTIGTTGTYNTFDWIYQDSGRKDFIVSSATEEEKMLVLSNALLKINQHLISCEEIKSRNIPDRLDEDYVACSPTKKGTHFYTESYVEKVYKELYGKDSILDKKAIMLSSPDHDKFVYDERIHGYVEYKSMKKEEIKDIEEGYFRSIIKTEYADGYLKIYENVVLVEHNRITDEYTKPKNYQKVIYTFKKEDDRFIYLSRKIYHSTL